MHDASALPRSLDETPKNLGGLFNSVGTVAPEPTCNGQGNGISARRLGPRSAVNPGIHEHSHCPCPCLSQDLRSAEIEMESTSSDSQWMIRLHSHCEFIRYSRLISFAAASQWSNLPISEDADRQADTTKGPDGGGRIGPPTCSRTIGRLGLTCGETPGTKPVRLGRRLRLS